jgi:hypothetical protein
MLPLPFTAISPRDVSTYASGAARHSAAWHAADSWMRPPMHVLSMREAVLTVSPMSL